MLHSQLGERLGLVLVLAIGLERSFAFDSCICSLIPQGNRDVVYYERLCCFCSLDQPESSDLVFPSFLSRQKLKQVQIDR